ncbi:hypothetical protein GKZ75_08465 [Kocuria indica]|uniref:Uncharacterized protein n=1 Tax=Kocuria marina subsp. indica TaxID=1049583 RepID=A0A6N9QYE3_9MICC|nr:hypothetical protein [Kocuria indica]NDO78255.1 hypothetical protein [Kocuria indica]
MTWTPERHAESRAALNDDLGQWTGEYGSDALDEIDRLTRALADARTVTPEMVERAAREIYRPDRWDEVLHSTFMDADQKDVILAGPRARARTILDAALNPEGEE